MQSIFKPKDDTLLVTFSDDSYEDTKHLSKQIKSLIEQDYELSSIGDLEDCFVYLFRKNKVST